MKFGLRSNLVANFTVNTDFADADVDTRAIQSHAVQTLLPGKAAVLFGECRSFQLPPWRWRGPAFLQPPDRDRSHHRRRGAGQWWRKVTGSLRNFALGVMDVETRSSGPNPYANYAVMRVKRSLWGGSYLGVMGIDKRSGNPNDSFNQTSGADTRLVFFRNLVVNGFAAQSRTPGVNSGQSDLGAVT